MPCHADEKGSVVTEIRGPPVLRLCHQFTEVLLYGLKVETPELFSIVKFFAHWIGLRGMLVQDIELQLAWPPISVRCTAALNVFVISTRLAIFIHNIFPFYCVNVEQAY